MKNLFLCLLLLSVNICMAQSLVVPPPPAPGFSKVSDTYLISVTQNGVTKKCFTYQSKAGNGGQREWGREQGNNFHFTGFSFSGTVTVEVIKLNSSANSVIIRPTRLGIVASPVISSGADKKISFTLSKATKVSVEFNDDPQYKDALMIFADNLEKAADIPDKNNGNIYYIKPGSDIGTVPPNATAVFFKPGVYKIGYWNIPFNVKQVYIAGGAYVMGYLNRDHSTIKINGRGILSNEGYNYHYPSTGAISENDKAWYKMININGGQNHVIEGITLIEGTSYNIIAGGNNMLIKNVKISGFRFNNDGIGIGGTGNLISDCFIRSNDDAIGVSGTRLTVSNCSFWQLQGSVFQLGWSAHSMDSISISNCDVLHDKATFSEGNTGFINAMNYTASLKAAVIQNFSINNIYFDTPVLRFMDIRGDRKSKIIDYGPTSGAQPWIYKNFTVNNIYLKKNTANAPLIFLHGLNDDHPLSNFVFTNIYIDNKRINTDLFNNSSFADVKALSDLQVK